MLACMLVTQSYRDVKPVIKQSCTVQVLQQQQMTKANQLGAKDTRIQALSQELDQLKLDAETNRSKAEQV